MVRLFSKTPKETEEAIGFEPEEQKTPWLGRILLIILAVVLLYFGWAGLGDLGRIPNRPEPLSECSGLAYYEGRIDKIDKDDVSVRGGPAISYTEHDYRTQIERPRVCVFSSYERTAGADKAYREAQTAFQKKDNFTRTQLEPLQNQLSNLQSVISQKQKEYDLSLQEVQAGKPPVGKTTEQIRKELQDLQNQKNSVSAELVSAQSQLLSFDNELKSKEGLLIDKINKAIDLYNKAWAGYKFRVFLLEIIFVLPFFAVSIWFYFRLLRKTSPHTIILLPIVFTAAVLLARTILVYFWAWFLADLAEILLRLTQGLWAVRILLFYAGMILAIVIFGGAVYILQRNIFAPARVRLRRLKAKKCPHCETPFEFTKSFCAGCGGSLLAKCPNCGQDKFMDFKFCPHCGKQ